MDSQPRLGRRSLLRAAATAGGVTLAGCNGTTDRTTTTAADTSPTATCATHPDLSHLFRPSTGKATRRECFVPDTHAAERPIGGVAGFAEGDDGG